MKKNVVLLLLSGFVVLSCSSQKKKPTSVGLRGFYAYYNTLFNAKDAYETEVHQRRKNYKENYFSPYIPLLVENHLVTADGSNLDLEYQEKKDAENEGKEVGFQEVYDYSALQVTELKALKAIEKYSVMKNGAEKNKRLFDAYILLAKSRLLMNKPLEALDGLSGIFVTMPKHKNIDLAKIYQAQAYAEMRDYFRANEIFSKLKKDKNLKKTNQALLSLYYAEMLLHFGKKNETIKELENAFELNTNRNIRSRIAFLRGQILAELGKKEQARESFAQAYRYASGFEFEVKSQIEIAKTFSGNDEQYLEAKKYLEGIQKKGIYASRKNEFDYALGILALNANKKQEALNYFKTSTKGVVSDPHIRGLAYYQIGKDFFDKDDYISAGRYYDSAVAVMTYAPVKNHLISHNKDIKKFTENYYLIRKNDSILNLTKMSSAELEKFFSQKIKDLKEKEEKQEQIDKKNKKESSFFDAGDYNANSIFANNTGGFVDFSAGNKSSGFYFANANTVRKGVSEFKQIWGDRALADNWRYSKPVETIEDAKQSAMGTASTKDPRRFEVAFYTEKIPTQDEEKLALKKSRDTASLSLGRMYHQFFNKTEEATKTLYDLVDVQPEDEVKLQALYHIFVMNYEKNPEKVQRAKNMILEQFPNTSYAEFVKNPKKADFSAADPEVEKLYHQAYEFYNLNKFSEAEQIVNQVNEKFPKDFLVPKFDFLQALIYGKVKGKEPMKMALEKIVLNYPVTYEAEKAKEILQKMKGEIPEKPQKKSDSSIPKNQENNPLPARKREEMGGLSNILPQGSSRPESNKKENPKK